MEEEIPTCQKAAPYEKPNFPISVREIEVPKPDFDEILVKVLFSGVCHSGEICFDKYIN
jgi:Zn-dependent alcohol dehydrogenase